ncbi:MAG: HEAT repeat domain-containing protein [Chloroflexi bacterium]|nr:HEAT repeat domain-containing protein [Chloroflexota bacterium]
MLIGGMAPIAAAGRANDNTPPQRIYSRQADGIWASDDAGISWTKAGALPSRPLAMAVALGTPGLVFVGTESRGLLRSNDGGASWQPVDSTVLSWGNAAPLAVTALAIDPEDEQIVYAATNIWLGTNTARLSPLGVAVSVDGGRQWLQLSTALLSDAPLQHLEPIAGQPLAVTMVNSTGSPHTVSLALNPELLGLLQNGAPAVRASAARAIGLIGDPAALPGLMQALADPDALAGQRIAEAIGSIGDRSVSVDLLAILNSAPAAERTVAARALGLLKSAEAVPGLAALLSAGDPEAQRVAAEALAAIGTPAALAALTAPLSDRQMTSARHAAMGGLETAGPSAVAPLAAALHDGNAVVRANAAEMLGWLKPADAVADLARLLSDPDPTVQAQAAWALGEINTEPARLALNPAPLILAPGAPILAPVARPVAPAPLAALPGAIADVPTDYWTLAAMAALLVLAMLAGTLIGKGPRPTSHLGPA